jgi:phytoene dehydrogenase-like protein
MSLTSNSYDAVVVGSGCNGLAAAIQLAKHGRSVVVIEAKDEIGGACRTSALTLPNFMHDVFSAVHPMALQSSFFESLPLDQHGLKWTTSPIACAHPLDGGDAVCLHQSISKTATMLIQDEYNYRRLFEPLLKDWSYLKTKILSPFKIPRNPLRMARFGLQALLPADVLARAYFRTARARALFGGLAAHSVLPLDKLASSAVALTLGLCGHDAGWPFPIGGAGAIAKALASYLKAIGGQIITGMPIRSLKQLPPSRAVLFDLTPRQIQKIAGEVFDENYQRALKRYRYGPGAFKLDWALDGPIPWRAHEVGQAATVHVGGTLDKISFSERTVATGGHPDRPFVLLVQPSLFDPTRAPEGKHTAWAYCHVPNGSTRDMTERIEAQVEQFAPGFRDLIIGRRSLPPADLEKGNENLVGGDITGGSLSMQQLVFRPTRRLYATSNAKYFICSSSTPPGAGVHGLCGHYAAMAVLRSGL